MHARAATSRSDDCGHSSVRVQASPGGGRSSAERAELRVEVAREQSIAGLHVAEGLRGGSSRDLVDFALDALRTLVLEDDAIGKRVRAKPWGRAAALALPSAPGYAIKQRSGCGRGCSNFTDSQSARLRRGSQCSGKPLVGWIC